MDFITLNLEPHTTSCDELILFVFKENNVKKNKYIRTDYFNKLNKILDGKLDAFSINESFVGDKGEIISLFTQGQIVPAKVTLIGLGKKDDFNLNLLREVIGKYTQSRQDKLTTLAIYLPKILTDNVSNSDIIYYLVEGLELSTYDFAQYKKKKENSKKLESVVFIFENKSDTNISKKVIEKAQLFSKATRLARDLVNEQAAIATPQFLANLAKDIAKSSKNISCKVYDRAEIEKIGMDAFLGIARAAGDDIPPKFIELIYTPLVKKGNKKLAIVGKGITFDSGGINVKPGDHMQEMKMDMAGAASVLGIFSVIDKVKPSFPVLGLIAATPNLISGKSLVPGDVVKAMNGKTIEVLNTDAEGRVTLADSLSYAVSKGSTHIIDFATLTGAALVALGDEIAAIFSNNQKFIDEIKISANKEGEKVWELPLEKEYKELNHSDVADIANIPKTRYGGTITAALFLEEFVSSKPWIHFDIAGPAFANKKYPLGPKGGTGFGVRTILNYIEKENI